MDRFLIVAAIVTVAACSSDTLPSQPPGFGPDGASLVVVGTQADGLKTPMGLAFAPDHPDQLWVVNQETNGVVIFFDPGTSSQRAETRIDRYAEHFMPAVSGIAFGIANSFATCPESRNYWDARPKQTPDDYMGPSLWSANLDIFAMGPGQAFPFVKGAREGSHIDMLHESPFCMGITHEAANVYWAFDGGHGHIVRYDFERDHGPGGASHSNGRVRRFPEVSVTRVEGTASQLGYHEGRLYIADTGAGRILRLDTSSGHTGEVDSPPATERLAEYSQVTGAVYETLVDGLKHPSGLVLYAGGLIVADAASGELIAFSLDGKEVGRITTGARALMGLTIGPDGKLYFVDREAATVTRVDGAGTSTAAAPLAR